MRRGSGFRVGWVGLFFVSVFFIFVDFGSFGFVFLGIRFSISTCSLVRSC